MASVTRQLAATRPVGVRTTHSAGPRRMLRVQAAKNDPPLKLGELRPNITPREREAAPAPAKAAPAKAAPAKAVPAKAVPAKAAPEKEEQKAAPEASAPPEKDIVYIGKGKFVKDDVRKYPNKENVLGLTGLTGGWAGGEKGLVDIRASYKGVERKEKVKAEPKVCFP
eukprot:816236-Prorocentrum_minimum.AAC.8